MTPPNFSLMTWNVNSVRARLDMILEHLETYLPDVVCMQETKVEDKLFPRVPFMELGYQVHLHGGKALAGVATLTKGPATDLCRGFRDGEADRHPRVLSLLYQGVRIYNLYAPNGTSLDSDAFPYKLAWFERLRQEAAALREAHQPFILCGDFNIAPSEIDCWNAEEMRDKLHFTASEHAVLDALKGVGLVDCYRTLHPDTREFSWFDYRQQAWIRKAGLRIDHVYASPELAPHCRSVTHEYATREGEGASDHVAVLARFAPNS